MMAHDVMYRARKDQVELVDFEQAVDRVIGLI